MDGSTALNAVTPWESEIRVPGRPAKSGNDESVVPAYPRQRARRSQITPLPGGARNARVHIFAEKRGRARSWSLRFEPRRRPVIEPLMGWTASRDPTRHIQIRFPSPESAAAFAERNGWAWVVDPPHEPRRRPKSYAQKFA